MTNTPKSTDFTTFGDLLRHLRRRARMTQRDLGQAVGYSEAQIARLEGGSRLPDVVAVKGVFVEALDLKREPALAARLVELAEKARQEPAQLDVDGHADEAIHHPETNLPAQLTRFVGREHDILEIKRLLGSTRMLTLTGSGGAGKTRLALEVARDLVNEYADGVMLAEFAAISDPSLVADAVLRIFNLPPTTRQPLSALSEFLRHKRLLLVLDNCEHLIDACAHLAETLLRACPHLQLLTTSREALKVPGELTWRVPEMALDDAARLFVNRAQANRPEFAITDKNTSLITQLCERLDCMPLAIELAAAHVGGMKLEEIVARLDDRFHLLTGGSRTALPRQQTLRATIEWSYELLSEPERKLLQRMSVFAGGASIDAAEAVCADGDAIKQADVLHLLLQLCSKSLVMVDERHEATRYVLLETVKEYAREQLLTSGNDEPDASFARHLAFYTKLLKPQKQSSEITWRANWMNRLECEYGNLQVALSEIERRNNQNAASEVLQGLYDFCSDRGYLREGMTWIRKIILPCLIDGSVEQAKAIWCIGFLALRKGDWAQSREYIQQAKAIAEHVEDPDLLVVINATLSIIAYAHEEAIASGKEAIRIAETTAKTHYLWVLYTALGDRESARGNLDEAAQWLDLSLKIASANEEVESFWALRVRGIVEYERGNFEQALTFCRSSLKSARDAGDKISCADALVEIATITLVQKNIPESIESLCEAMQIYHWAGNDERVAQCLAVASGIAHSKDRKELSVRLLASTSSLRYGPPMREDDTTGFFKLFDVQLSALRAGVEADNFDRAWREGQKMTLDQAFEEALALCAVAPEN